MQNCLKYDDEDCRLGTLIKQLVLTESKRKRALACVGVVGAMGLDGCEGGGVRERSCREECVWKS